MKQINVTIQRTGSDFKIATGLPDDNGIHNAAVFVSFIHRQVHIIAWIEQGAMPGKYDGVCRQLIAVAERQSSMSVM